MKVIKMFCKARAPYPLGCPPLAIATIMCETLLSQEEWGTMSPLLRQEGKKKNFFFPISSFFFPFLELFLSITFSFYIVSFSSWIFLIRIDPVKAFLLITLIDSNENILILGYQAINWCPSARPLSIIFDHTWFLLNHSYTSSTWFDEIT